MNQLPQFITQDTRQPKDSGGIHIFVSYTFDGRQTDVPMTTVKESDRQKLNGLVFWAAKNGVTLTIRPVQQ